MSERSGRGLDGLARAAAARRTRRDVLKLGAGLAAAGFASALPLAGRAGATISPRDRCVDYCDRFRDPLEQQCTKGCRQCAGAQPCTPCVQEGCVCVPTAEGFNACTSQFVYGTIEEPCSSSAECRAEYGPGFVCTQGGCVPLCGAAFSASSSAEAQPSIIGSICGGGA